MPTIKDIADRLGIAVSTVSKGLNGASDISEETRQLVLDTAVEMGYASKKSVPEQQPRSVCSLKTATWTMKLSISSVMKSSRALS